MDCSILLPAAAASDAAAASPTGATTTGFSDVLAAAVGVDATSPGDGDTAATVVTWTRAGVTGITGVAGDAGDVADVIDGDSDEEPIDGEPAPSAAAIAAAVAASVSRVVAPAPKVGTGGGSQSNIAVEGSPVRAQPEGPRAATVLGGRSEQRQQVSVHATAGDARVPMAPGAVDATAETPIGSDPLAGSPSAAEQHVAAAGDAVSAVADLPAQGAASAGPSQPDIVPTAPPSNAGPRSEVAAHTSGSGRPMPAERTERRRDDAVSDASGVGDAAAAAPLGREDVRVAAAGPSNLAQRVAAAVTALESAPDPKTMTLDLDELGGLRVTVTLNGDRVSVDVVSGPRGSLPPGWDRELDRVLSERGFAYDGSPDRDSGADDSDDGWRPPVTAGASTTGAGRGTRRDGLQL